ncbi:hypothetical protein ACF3N7_09980 [Cruoricaptor ignavus]|uniref:hypothetical protein n=1 Tax=Cruoricaptor ignavus TaxID=1118202 RepID=UPI00370DBA8D
METKYLVIKTPDMRFDNYITWPATHFVTPITAGLLEILNADLDADHNLWGNDYDEYNYIATYLVPESDETFFFHYIDLDKTGEIEKSYLELIKKFYISKGNSEQEAEKLAGEKIKNPTVRTPFMIVNDIANFKDKKNKELSEILLCFNDNFEFFFRSQDHYEVHFETLRIEVPQAWQEDEDIDFSFEDLVNAL